MSILSSFEIGGSALTAQRLRMDGIANDIANAETTREDTGSPYKRQDVAFILFSADNIASNCHSEGRSRGIWGGGVGGFLPTPDPSLRLGVTAIRTDQREEVLLQPGPPRRWQGRAEV